MRGNKIFLVAGFCLAAAACNDGGADGKGGVIAAPSPSPTATLTPTPTPSPTSPAPTPTPTPGSGYLRFTDLTGSQSFRAGCAGITLRATGLTPALDGIHPFDNAVIMSFTSDPRTFTINRFNNSYTQTFQPRDKDSLAPTRAVAYTKVVSPSQSDTFLLDQSAIAGTPLDYVRRTVSTLQVAAVQHCVLGITTRLDDFPTAPATDYTSFAIDGIVYDRSSGSLETYQLSPSTMQFRIDWSTGTVAATVHLIGTPNIGPNKDFGTFSGAAPLDPATGGFAGSLDSMPGSVTSQFSGTVFGPQAKEFGFAFNLGHMTGSPSDYDLVIVGTAAGTY